MAAHPCEQGLIHNAPGPIQLQATLVSPSQGPATEHRSHEHEHSPLVGSVTAESLFSVQKLMHQLQTNETTK